MARLRGSEQGLRVYAEACASCHGADGKGDKGGSVVDAAYLALVSDQALRTAVIAGRTDLGMPDWRSDIPGQPLTAQQIADVVAWACRNASLWWGGRHERLWGAAVGEVGKLYAFTGKRRSYDGTRRCERRRGGGDTTPAAGSWRSDWRWTQWLLGW